MKLEDKQYLLDKNTNPVDIYNLIEWILWETPSQLIPNKQSILEYKQILRTRYSMFCEQDILDSINSCDVFLEE